MRWAAGTVGSPERYCLKILVRPKALSQKRGVPDPRTTLCEGILTIVCKGEARGTAGALDGAGEVEDGSIALDG